jgi:glutamine amidotransferase
MPTVHVIERCSHCQPFRNEAGIRQKDMMAIVDYGAGNLWSVQNGLARVGVQAQVSADPGVIAHAEAVVFPGVGAFCDCMQNLTVRGLDEALRAVIGAGRPVLAICVGMQALLTDSEEFGLTPGLGILEGHVRRFPAALPEQATRLKVPHMGWNQLHQRRACPLLDGIPDGAFAYFVHSYYAVPTDPEVVVACTDYGVDFASVLWRDNLYATQFHPEKSQTYGLQILRNFVTLSQGRDRCR